MMPKVLPQEICLNSLPNHSPQDCQKDSTQKIAEIPYKKLVQFLTKIIPQKKLPKTLTQKILQKNA